MKTPKKLEVVAETCPYLASSRGSAWPSKKVGTQSQLMAVFVSHHCDALKNQSTCKLSTIDMLIHQATAPFTDLMTSADARNKKITVSSWAKFTCTLGRFKKMPPNPPFSTVGKIVRIKSQS